MQHALPHLRAVKGTIVNISSLAGELGLWRDAVYCATKGAISSFTKALAVDESTNGVRVNAVLPGNILAHSRAVTVAQAIRSQELHEFLESWQMDGSEWDAGGSRKSRSIPCE